MTLWFDKFKDSNSFLRITLWNSLEYPLYYFTKISSLKEKQQLNGDELNKLAEVILEGKVSSAEEIDSLKNKRTQQSLFKQLNSSCLKVGDFRTQLWLPLPIDDKILMILSEHNKNESDLMSLLIFNQYAPLIKIIKKIDNKMENTLSNMFYDRYVLLSQQKASEATIKRLGDFLKHCLEDQNSAVSLSLFLNRMQDKILKSLKNKGRELAYYKSY